MTPLSKIVAAHPLRSVEPYSRIKFSRAHPNGTALYKVGNGKREFGAEKALRTAFHRFGGNCFHCEEPIPRESTEFTLDHLRPKRAEGGDHLHNLVFACKRCNWSKAGDDLASFEARAATEYLKALDDHLVRCLKKIGETERK